MPFSGGRPAQFRASVAPDDSRRTQRSFVLPWGFHNVLCWFQILPRSVQQFSPLPWLAKTALLPPIGNNRYVKRAGPYSILNRILYRQFFNIAYRGFGSSPIMLIASFTGYGAA